MFHVNGYVRGFHQKVADTGLPVFHHQLAGVIIVFAAAVAYAGQQVIDLVAQTTLRQRHVEHGFFFGGRGGFQPVQLVEIEGEAHSRDVGGKLPGQQVITASFEHRRGQTGQITLKYQTVVILHITGQRQIQTDDLILPGELTAKAGQFGQRLRHLLIFHQSTGAGQRLFYPARQLQQSNEGIGVGQSGLLGFLPQAMGTFAADLLQQCGPQGIFYLQRIQQTGEKAHVGQFQPKFGATQGQSVQCQPQLIPNILLGKGAHALQTHLVDLHKGVAFPTGTVDLFVVVVLFALTGGGLDVFGDGQGHIGLEGQQTAVQIGEGQNLLGGQKATVLLVQAIFLETAHVIFAVACLFGQGPQLKCRPLGPFENAQIEVHRGVFLYSDFIITALYFIVIKK